MHRLLAYMLAVALCVVPIATAGDLCGPSSSCGASDNVVTYYVDDTDGSDSNSGLSAAAAWKTIAKVNGRAFNPGNQILFQRGETFNGTMLVPPSSGLDGKPIVFGAYGVGEKPVLDSAAERTSWTVDTGDVYFHSLASDPNAVLVDSILAPEETVNVAALDPGEWFYDLGATRLYFETDGVKAITDYTIKTFNLANTASISAGIDYIRFTDLVFQGPAQFNGLFASVSGLGIEVIDSEFHDFWGYGIQVQGGASDDGSWLLSGSEFHDAGRTVFAAWQINASSTSEVIIDGNTFDAFHYDGTSATNSDVMKAIEVTNSDTVRISNNTIRFSNVTGDTTSINSSTNAAPIIEGNTIFGGNHGIHLKDAASGGIVRWNRIVDPGDDGIWASGTTDGCLIHHNLILRSLDDGIDLTSATGCLVHNNTVARSVDTGIVVRAASTGTILRNNILSNNGQPGTPVTGDEGGHEISVTTDSQTGFDANFNLYFHITAKVTAVPFSWGSTSYDFTDWKTQTSGDANTFNTDPLFLGVDGEDAFAYSLDSDAPGDGTGTYVGLLHDIVGDPPRDPLTPSMGAVERLGGERQ